MNSRIKFCVFSFKHPSFLPPLMPPDCVAEQTSAHRSLFQANPRLVCKSHHDCCLPPPLCIPLARLLKTAAFSFQSLNGRKERPTHTKQLRSSVIFTEPNGAPCKGSRLGSHSLTLSPCVRITMQTGFKKRT